MTVTAIHRARTGPGRRQSGWWKRAANAWQPPVVQPRGSRAQQWWQRSKQLRPQGAFFARGDRPAHIITTQIEHPSILVPCEFLERQGARVTYLPVDDTGLVNPDDVRRVITRNTILDFTIYWPKRFTDLSLDSARGLHNKWLR